MPSYSLDDSSCTYLAGRCVARSLGGPPGLHPHRGLGRAITPRLFEYLNADLIAVDYPAVQQLVAQQVKQGLQVLTGLDHPARQGLAREFDATTRQHFFKAMQR